MGIKFECPICRNSLSAKSDYVGKEGKCKCGAAVIVPGILEKMKFACMHCGKGISVSIRHAGKQGKCPTCKNIITVPLLGILSKTDAQTTVAKPIPKASVDIINFSCAMCNANLQAHKSSAGKIKECPECGSFMEIPGQQPTENTSDTSPAGLDSDSNEIEAGAKPAVSTGKVRCPSCEDKLPNDAPVCTHCGIFVKSGRPILTAWDIDEDEIEEKAEGVVRTISWLIPFGLYPVYSEAMGNHKPYATWAITTITVLISIWFLVLEYSGSPKMQTAKNMMLWSSNAEPNAEHIQLFYTYTNYGDSEAFFAKRQELSETVPEDELDMAALKALSPKERCFGEFKIHQLLTHAFLHSGIMHLAGNMLFFLVFGSRVNAVIGNILTLILYPILAVAAAMTHLMSLGIEVPIPMLGASGAVMGMAGAYLLLFPIHKVFMVIWMRWGLMTGFHLSYKCFSLRGFWVVLFYIMFDIIAVSLTVDDGTAHWAHIGGLVWGFIFAFFLLTARLAYSRSDILSLIFGKYAWRLFGTPANRMK